MKPAWHEVYELPPYGNMMQPGPKARENFIKLGDGISKGVHSAFINYLGDTTGKKILDFGCGVGRIAMPLFHEHRYPTHAVDVSPWCIGYLKRQLKDVNIRKTDNLPPIPFEDNSFDGIYSISVWTHLPLERQWPWLREINRVLKPGGFAMISTSGMRALRYRREERHQAGWIGVSDDDLRLEGIIYKDCDPKHHDGVEGAYGYVAHDPDWTRREWGRLFEYVDFLPAAVFGMQDINVLRKIRDVKPSDLTLIGLEGDDQRA